eukprot:gene14514-16661_t
MERLLTYRLEQNQANSVLRVQLLDTAACGPASILSVQLLMATGAVQVYLVDAAAALHLASQQGGNPSLCNSTTSGLMFPPADPPAHKLKVWIYHFVYCSHLSVGAVSSGRAQAFPEVIPLGPVLTIPFESAAAGVSPGGISTIFSFNRASAAAQREETVMAAVIEQSSVRTVGRGSSTVSSKDHLSQPPAASFIVRIAGSEGTEISATYRSAQQQVLDALVELGSAVFSRAHTELATTTSAAAAGKPLLAPQLQQTVFKMDGSILSSKEIEVSAAANAGEVGPELLWRACVRLQLLPSWRLPALTATIAQMDSSADSSSNANKYFAVSRAVLMEAALAGGLGHLVAQYVLVRSEGPDSGDFLLSDVKRVYEWAVGGPSTVSSMSQVP